MSVMKKALPLLMMILLACLCLSGAALAEGDRFAFDRTVTTLFEGESLATVLERAGNAAEGEVTYVSSAKKNASVDAQGVVTGLNKGQTTITATLQNAGRSFRATITLTILRRVESVALNEERVALHRPGDAEVAGLLGEATEHPVLVLPLGRVLTAPVVCLPEGANDRRAILTSSDEGVVKVQGYNLTPVAAGECDLTVASRQNPEVTATYRVLVVTPVRSLRVSGPKEPLWVGETSQLTAECTPADATITAVTWQSSNEQAVTVDENGVVTACKKGTASVIAKATDGSGRTANITIRVRQQPTEITLNETDLVVNMGQAKTLRATVGPQNADDRQVTWESSDEGVATVNAYGRVTPVSVGECVITCRAAAFPEVAASCRVSVHQLVTKVSFPAKSVTCNVGGTCLLFWEVAPVTATSSAVTFRSSNEKVATVDENGLVTGLKRGSCTVTATAADGSGRRGSVKVNVLQPVTGVHMYSDTLLVGVEESVKARAVLEPENASNTAMTWTSADPSIATVKGNKTRPSVTGHRWGETTITGVTEDGGYTTTATVKVGNYDRALRITDLYLSDNRIKINVRNDSNMNVTRFYFLIECYDVYGGPLTVSATGSNCFDGSYSLTLAEGETTQHGRFGFGDYVQPDQQIGRVVMRITGYRTDEGYSRSIREDRQPTVEYISPAWIGGM